MAKAGMSYQKLFLIGIFVICFYLLCLSYDSNRQKEYINSDVTVDTQNAVPALGKQTSVKKSHTRDSRKGRRPQKTSSSNLFGIPHLSTVLHSRIKYINYSKSMIGETIDDVLPHLKSIKRNFLPDDLAFVNYGVNVTLSASISFDRVIKDTRPESCPVIQLENLPKFTVIIPFFNEVWSLLIRGLHSIIRKSPTHLLEEIVLVNDASEFANNRETLVNYVTSLPKVKVLHTKKREGLIRARNLGALAAKSEVIVFLDAHIEVNKGWIEPLLETVSLKRNVIAIPWIDIIQTGTLEYMVSSRPTYGSFSWQLDFEWVDIPKSLLVDPSVPIPTATASGCAMVMRRDYFLQSGMFDDGMSIWGGENLEISFRTWMCGGSLLIHPCSRIGHVFRAYLPYSLPKTVLRQNLQRVADVWMDEYAQYYYRTTGVKVNYTEEQLSNLQERKELRGRLQCRSFRWYLENIAKVYDHPRMSDRLYGQLQNLDNSMCLTTKQYIKAKLAMCSKMLMSQVYHISTSDNIVGINGLCLSHKESNNASTIEPCTGKNSQKWSLIPFILPRLRILLSGVNLNKPVGQIRLKSNMYTSCLTAIDSNDVDIVKCDENDTRQYWIATHRVYENLYYEESGVDVT